MSNSIPDCLATTRPSRSSRRAAQLGIDQDPNKLAPQPVPQQIGIKFAHNGQQMALVLSIGSNTIPIPMTPDGWDELAAAGDSIADQLRAAIAAGPVAEPVMPYHEGEAEPLRTKIELAVQNYGKAIVPAAIMYQAFRAPDHTRNWARKHHLDTEADTTGQVTFTPAPLERIEAGPLNVRPEPAYEKPYILPV